MCLPDQFAKESVSLIHTNNSHVKVIDASTAHRTNSNWAYGFAELSSRHRQNIKDSRRVAVGGCYASGFIAMCYPLVEHGIILDSHLITSYGISGYSGGGKAMIKEYEENPKEYVSPRFYALNQNHKHLPEMKYVTGLLNEPVFNPIVDDFYSGMVVNIPLHVNSLNKKLSAKELQDIFQEHYANQKLLEVMPFSEDTGFMNTNELSNTSKMQIYVHGNQEQILLSARFDNLGKGASGSAVQCMNIMMGIDETTGL